MGADRDSLAVVIHAPIGRDAPATADLLRRNGSEVLVCTTLAEVIAGVEAGTAAVFIAEEGLFNKDIAPLTDWVAAQPTWSDLPFVILTSKQELPAVVAWRQRMVAALGNVSLLERPVQSITLTSTIQSAVRARVRQYEVRALLEAREEAAKDLSALVHQRTEELARANAELHLQIKQRTLVEENLRQAQKIEALGQLTGGVAHDFNNLLMVILGGLDMLDRPADPARRKRLMDGMRQAAQRGAGLTRQLLAFSRRQALQPEPVDLGRQLGGMRELLDRTLRGDVHVQFDFAEDLWPIEVDPGELELVILNLAVNARDAMPGGGTIVIEARNETVAVEGDARQFVRVAVIDTGAGIPNDVIDRVFDPFFTTKDIGKGSGLGLAQVHGFATQSGGSVSVVSTVGEGTQVIMLLPKSARLPLVRPHHVVDDAERQSLVTHAGCALLVEDDDEVASLVAEMLAQLGYDVTRAASAEAALGALADEREVDIVFSDIMMPGGMNGVDLAREIRRRRPKLPLLLTSGYAGAAKMVAEADGVRILPKPYLFDDLAVALREVRLSAPS